MVWVFWNEWPSSAQFNFKCYCRWDTMVVQNTEDGSGRFFHNKEGVTQGYSLAMITYNIGILPLIRELRDAHPRIT